MRLPYSLCLLALLLFITSCQSNKESDLIDQIIRMKFAGDTEGERKLARNCVDNTCEFIYSFISQKALKDLEIPESYYVANYKKKSFYEIAFPDLKPEEYQPITYKKGSLFYEILKEEYEILYQRAEIRNNFGYNLDPKQFEKSWFKKRTSELQTLYFKEKYIKNKLVYFTIRNKNNESNLLFQFLMCYINDYTPEFIPTIYRLNTNLALNLYKEREDEMHYDKIDFYLKQAKNNSRLIGKTIIRSNQMVDEGNYEKALDILETESLDSCHIYDKLNALNLFAVIHKKLGNNSLSKEYLSQVNKEYLKQSCSNRSQILKLLKLDAAESRLEYQETYKEVMETFTCPMNGDYFQYRSTLFEIDNKWNPLTPIEKLDILSKRWNLAQRIYGFELNDHLQDLYAQITHEKLSNYQIIQNELTHDSLKNIINLLNATKSIGFKTRRELNRNSKEVNGISILDSIIALTNYGIDTNYYLNPIYLELDKYIPFIGLEKNQDIPQFRKVNTISKEIQFIEFFQFEDVYWRVSYLNDKIELSKINSEILENFIESFYLQLEEKQDINSICYKINNLLLPKNLTGKIVIIPDGQLTSFPFELLNDSSNFNYHFSLPEYLKLNSININTDKICLYSYSGKNTIRDYSKKEYPELIFGYEEVQNIKVNLELKDYQLFCGEAFTKESLDQSSNGGIWHISSHANSVSDNRYKSYFLLRKDNQVTDTLYGFQIENELAVPEVAILSACETGEGTFVIGNGTYSIARSFLEAGSDTVMKTCWKVNEKATALFMNKFYLKWKNGNTLAYALRKTKEEFKNSNEYYHPYYWAGFIIEGNGNVYLESKSKI